MKVMTLLVVFALALPSMAFADDTAPPATTTKRKKKKAPVAQPIEKSAEAPDLSGPPDMAGRLGGGGMVGSPISVNGKYWINSKMAVELGLGFGFIGLGGFQPFADFLYNFGPVFGNSTEFTRHMSLFVGGGAFAMFGSYGGVLGVGGVSATEVGFFLPAGVTWMPSQIPNVEFYAQAGPGYGFGSVSASSVTIGGQTVAGGTSVGIGGFVWIGGAGARYYFY